MPSLNFAIFLSTAYVDFTMMYLLYRSIVVCKRVKFRSRKLDSTRNGG